MRKFLQSLITKKQNTINELREKMKTAETADEVREIGGQMDGLNDEIREIQAQIDALPPENATDPNAAANEGRSFNPLGAYGVAATRDNQTAQRSADPFSTTEYENAFMNFFCRNQDIGRIETREAGVINMAAGSAVIPTQYQSEIIRELKTYGNIWNKVRKTNVAAGVQYPILTLLPEATWIGENQKSDAQAIKADEKITFSIFGVECKLSQSLFANIMTLQAFKDMFIPLAVEAIVKALEVAILTGDGVNKFKGILKDDRVPAANVIEMTAEELKSWSAWREKVFAKMKKSYKNGFFFMAEGTYQSDVCGQVDSVGQPIARTTIGISDGVETYRYNGKIVETVEDDIITPTSAAVAGDVVAVFADLTKYVVNSPMQFRVEDWVDHDTHEQKKSIVLVGDGKLLDPYGVLIIKLKEDAAAAE